MSTTKLGQSRVVYGDPDDIHRTGWGWCDRHADWDFCGPILKQAARVDYRGKSLSAVMNEALVSGNCPLFRRPVR